jgi:predicted ester cyclase
MKKLRAVLALVVLLCFSSGCRDKEAMAKLGEYEAQAEVEQRNKDTVKRWISEMDKGNLGIVDELIAEDAKIYYGEETLGREWLRKMCEGFAESFSDSVHIIDDLVADEDRVVARLTVRVTDSRGFMGASPTGKTVEYHAYTLYRIETGKVRELWMDHNATMELMLKLGREVKPEKSE